jgi:hypothetical protein
VGQKVDADQNLDWDVGVWLVTVDLFVLLVCVLIWTDRLIGFTSHPSAVESLV